MPRLTPVGYVFGDLAVFTTQVADMITNKENGKTVVSHTRLTDIWIRRNDGWKLEALQESMVE
jgi:ketosteroid isomerase-like protein